MKVQDIILREEVMASPKVHYFAKDVLRMTKDKDPVDCLHDLDLVKRVIECELDACKF